MLRSHFAKPGLAIVAYSRPNHNVPEGIRERVSVDFTGQARYESITMEIGKGPNSDQESARRVARWIILLATAAWGIFAGSFLAYYSLPGGFVVSLVQKQFGAMILVPMAALMAGCAVMILEWTVGEVRFEGLGFKFEGASGPIVLWVFCFLAITVALRLFWDSR